LLKMGPEALRLGNLSDSSLSKRPLHPGIRYLPKIVVPLAPGMADLLTLSADGTTHCEVTH
jgi:hypothetical protein